MARKPVILNANCKQLEPRENAKRGLWLWSLDVQFPPRARAPLKLNVSRFEATLDVGPLDATAADIAANIAREIIPGLEELRGGTPPVDPSEQ